MTARDLALKLKERFGILISDPQEFRGEITVPLSDAEAIADVCAFAKADLGFDYLVDITSLDNYGSDPRWTLVYHLYGYGHHCALRLKTNVSEEASEAPTVSTVWRTADWHEREILMWEGYPYFPLRKDFPLAGKASTVPEVAFTKSAPLEGGPFVTVAGGADTMAREPRARVPDTGTVELNSRLERRADVKEMHGRAAGPGVEKEGK